MRLFVAVWPPPELIDLVAALPRPSVPGVRWTTVEQWHVTVRFLGEVEAGSGVDEVASRLNELSGTGAVTASVGPASAWFPGRHVLQVPVDGLDDLHMRAYRLLADAEAVAFEKRQLGPAYNGHLTLARVRGRAGLGGSVADSVAGEMILATWRVTTVSLVASTLRSDGASYANVASFRLDA
ncbi:MAG: RNA 2',3'-cyclic phosphodiesterase [Acidimicrobiales bacterium]